MHYMYIKVYTILLYYELITRCLVGIKLAVIGKGLLSCVDATATCIYSKAIITNSYMATRGHGITYM